MNTHKRARRLLAACHRCHSQKIKCSGEHPCRSCINVNKANDCKFPPKERKVTISESYLKKLEADSKRLKSVAIQAQTPETQLQSPANDNGPPPSLSPEESNILNPLFDASTDNTVNEPSIEPGFIGEASCSAFGNRLLQCLDNSYTPSTAGFSNYYRTKPHNRDSLTEQDYSLPDRIHAKLLLNLAWRFIGNYHHLFLKVTFMRELDAVYRKEIIPSTLWLSKFFALLSLGEIYTNRRVVNEVIGVPGTEYYHRAESLMPDSHEEAGLVHVEILILLAWCCNIYGRVRSAYSYSGTAMRLALSMGMHRTTVGGNMLTAVEREGRIRTWWVIYFFERITASKLGMPITIRDEDIDVQMPSMDGLTAEEREEFSDPINLITNVKLAKIMGNILTDIYGLPKSVNGMCVQRVHGILKKLRAWDEDLPSELRARELGTPRPVASLQLAYNQCIIQTTRPILLHLFKTQFRLGVKSPGPRRQNFSSITLALAESCVSAAQSSCRIIEGLFLDGTIAVFGYWDAHHLFSSALILLMSAVMKPSTQVSDALQTLLSILRSMKKDGNIPAVDYCERLAHMQARVSNLRTQGGMEQPIFNIAAPEAQASSSVDGVTQADASFAQDPPASTDIMGANANFGNIDMLANPLIDNFLDESRFDWQDMLFAEDGTLKQFASEIEEQFLFQL